MAPTATGTDAAVVLLSGGMDSVAALYDTVRRRAEVVATLSFHYGSKHNDREIPFAAWHARKCGVPHLTIPLDCHRASTLRPTCSRPAARSRRATTKKKASMKKTVVPFRNGIMFVHRRRVCREQGSAGALVIAAHAGDHAIYPDCREEFHVRAWADAIRLGT